MKKTIFIFLFSLLFPVIPLFARIRIPIPVPAGGAGIVVIIIIIIINIAIRVAGSGGKGSYVRVQKKLSTKLFNTGIFYCPNCKKQQEYSHYKLYYDINKFWSEYIECHKIRIESMSK